MSDDENINGEKRYYPDVLPDGLGDLEKIERLPDMQKHPPKIKWGDDFESWDKDRQLVFAMKLACAMNHAADVMQKDRNRLLEVCARQEAQLDQAKALHIAQGDTMHAELGRQDAERQEIYQQIQKLRTANRTLKGWVRGARADAEKLRDEHAPDDKLTWEE